MEEYVRDNVCWSSGHYELPQQIIDLLLPEAIRNVVIASSLCHILFDKMELLSFPVYPNQEDIVHNTPHTVFDILQEHLGAKPTDQTIPTPSEIPRQLCKSSGTARFKHCVKSRA
jgi:hypothetical protein